MPERVEIGEAFLPFSCLKFPPRLQLNYCSFWAFQAYIGKVINGLEKSERKREEYIFAISGN